MSKAGVLASIVSCALFFGVMSAEAGQSFDGFYTGVSVSGESSSSNVTGASSGNFDLGQKGVAGGVFAGYGMVLDGGYYIGAEAGVGLSSLSGSDSGRSVDVKRTVKTDVDVRLGYLFSKDMMAYVKTGVSYSKWQASVDGDKWVPGVLLGLGMEKMISDNIFMRIGYDVDISNAKWESSGVRSRSLVQTGYLGLGYKW